MADDLGISRSQTSADDLTRVNLGATVENDSEFRPHVNQHVFAALIAGRTRLPGNATVTLAADFILTAAVIEFSDVCSGPV